MRASWGLVTGGAVAAVVLPVVAGLRWSGYSHRSQYISELGATEAPDGGLVSAAFVVIGLLLVAGGMVLARSRFEPRSMVWVAAVVALALGGSYLVSGVAPCDPGCPDEGEVGQAQEVHDVAGALGYTVAVAGVAAGAFAARGSDAAPASLAAALVAVGALLLAAGPLDSWRGALQRLAELALLAWLVEVVRRLTAPSSDVINPTGPVATLSDLSGSRGRTPS